MHEGKIYVYELEGGLFSEENLVFLEWYSKNFGAQHIDMFRFSKDEFDFDLSREEFKKTLRSYLRDGHKLVSEIPEEVTFARKYYEERCYKAKPFDFEKYLKK